METPEDFPQDVRAAVEAIMAKVDAGADWSTEQCMARAIMAERERCLHFAEDAREPDEIAAAIRSGELP